MSRTDLVADSFTIVRNAFTTGKDEVVIPHSNLLAKICNILKDEGYVDNFKEVELDKFKKLKIYLRYDKRKSVITGIAKVSKPGRRVYVGIDTMPRVLGGYGIAILSTSKGVLTSKQAKEAGVGGEYVGKVW